MIVDKNTVLGESFLKNVTIDQTKKISTSMKNLSSFLYQSSVIDLMALSANTITFGFKGLPVHKKIIVRALFYTSCNLKDK